MAQATYKDMKIRLRESLRAKIEVASSAHDVSLNQEIVDRLQSTFDEEKLGLGIDALMQVAAGDARNAKILMMFASVLHVADISRVEENASEFDWLQTVSNAVTTILAVVNGSLLQKPYTTAEIDGMDEPRRNGILLADVILTRRGYPGAIEQPHKQNSLRQLMRMTSESGGEPA